MVRHRITLSQRNPLPCAIARSGDVESTVEVDADVRKRDDDRGVGLNIEVGLVSEALSVAVAAYEGKAQLQRRSGRKARSESRQQPLLHNGRRDGSDGLADGLPLRPNARESVRLSTNRSQRFGGTRL